jgi:hypothetical protein
MSLPDGHLTEECLAACIDGHLKGDARMDAIRHLASCDDCMRKFEDGVGLVKWEPLDEDEITDFGDDGIRDFGDPSDSHESRCDCANCANRAFRQDDYPFWLN